MVLYRSRSCYEIKIQCKWNEWNGLTANAFAAFLRTLEKSTLSIGLAPKGSLKYIHTNKLMWQNTSNFDEFADPEWIETVDEDRRLEGTGMLSMASAEEMRATSPRDASARVELPSGPDTTKPGIWGLSSLEWMKKKTSQNKVRLYYQIQAHILNDCWHDLIPNKS